jgi:hypothetical protein
VHILFATASTLGYSISISLCCVFAIVYTFMAYYTFNYTYVNNCSSCATTFSSLASFRIVYASIWRCSSTSSSSDSSMHTKFIDVVFGPIYSHACQRYLLLSKNSIANVLVIFVSWIIICVNCIFTLYAFHSVDSENDDECEATLQPMVEYSTLLISLLFSTPLLLFFFSIIPLPPPTFACVHSYVLPFPLLFAIIFQLHSLHSYCCEFQKLKNTHKF